MDGLTRVHRLLVPVLAFGCVAVAIPFGLAPEGARAAATVCSPVLATEAVGSGEKPSAPGGTTTDISLQTMKGELGGQAEIYSVQYPAVSVPAAVAGGSVGGVSYQQSRDNGVVDLRAKLYSRANQCPGERFVLAGYSQGADVVAAFVQSLDPTVPIDQYVLNHVAGVALFGDPRFNPSDGRNGGSFDPSKSGIFATFATPPSTSPEGVRGTYASAWRGRLVSYCNSGDPICNYSAGNMAWCTSLAFTPFGIVPTVSQSCPHFHYRDSSRRGDANATSAGHLLATQARIRSATPLFDDIVLPGGVASLAYDKALAISGGTAPLQVVPTGGALPPGLAITAAARLAGIPMQAGSFVVTLTVTETAGRASSAWFGVAVRPPLGHALAWGDDSRGALGDGSGTSFSNVPVAVRLASETAVSAIAAGDWGFGLALTSSGNVLAWGDNQFGELGDGGASGAASSVPISVSLPPGTKIVGIAAGGAHSLALTSTGQVLAWGNNHDGALGDGTWTDSNVPVAVSLPTGTTVTAIAAGWNHSLALTSSGQVLAWGGNQEGQLGSGGTNDSNVPVAASLPSGNKVVAIAAANAFHSLALTSTGELLAWGWNGHGELGDGTTNSSRVPVPVHLPGGAAVTAIATGSYHSLALTSTGQILAWGDNAVGQLGDGTPMTSTAFSDVPVTVHLPSGSAVAAIAAGLSHSLAVTTTGLVLAWGYNGTGQLGDGTTTDSNIPVTSSLPNGTTVTAVAGGGYASFVVTAQ